jgi:NifU-like protein involved in Fe-S cluster formation
MTAPDDPRCDDLPAGVGRASSDCGDEVTFRLWVRDGRIGRAEFEMRGCDNTLAVAAAAAALCRGMTPDEALGIDSDRIRAEAPPLPAGTEHAADVARDALRAALLDALRTRNEPWKRLYRTG